MRIKQSTWCGIKFNPKGKPTPPRPPICPITMKSIQTMRNNSIFKALCIQINSLFFNKIQYLAKIIIFFGIMGIFGCFFVFSLRDVFCLSQMTQIFTRCARSMVNSQQSTDNGHLFLPQILFS